MKCPFCCVFDMQRVGVRAFYCRKCDKEYEKVA